MIESDFIIYDDLPKFMKSIDSFPRPYSIEIGCGSDYKEPHSKWIHSDAAIHNTHLETHHLEMMCYSWDIPLENNSVKEIFAKGFWEHLSYNEAGRTLKEWNRVLMPGGTSLFNFPPIDHAIRMWQAGLVEFIFMIRVFYGWQFQERDIHRSGWTKEWIEKFLGDFPEFSIEEIYWGDSRVDENGSPLRLDIDPYTNAGSHLWISMRKKS